MPGVFVLCRALIDIYNYTLSLCPTKIGVNFESAGALPVLFTMVSVMPRTVPGMY